MGKKHRELAERHARLEDRIDIVAAAVAQPQREGSWTKIQIVVALVLAALTLGIGTLLTRRQLRQAELANVIAATDIGADTLQEEVERANAALRRYGRGEFTDTASRPEAAAEPRRAAPPRAPKMDGVMRADSGKVDSVVAQLAAASSPIIPMDSAGNPYVRDLDGRARIRVITDEPTGTQAPSTAAGTQALPTGGGFGGGGGGRKGLWVGPYGELVCAGTCQLGQVCCEEPPDVQR